MPLSFSPDFLDDDDQWSLAPVDEVSFLFSDEDLERLEWWCLPKSLSSSLDLFLFLVSSLAPTDRVSDHLACVSLRPRAR